jgi:DNA-binding response OmpR family regulator
MRALVVEDEATLREGLREQLVKQGFTVDVAADGEEGLFAGNEYPLDIAVIDLGLPKISGLELIRKLRTGGKTFPILILTARDRWQDKVEGLQAGADDYVAKPFDGPVLAARLRAVLRRAGRHQAGGDRLLRADGLEVDPAGMSARVDGEPVALTTTEARLLIELARNVGIVLDRATLLERVWDYRWDGDTRLVDVHVQRLRAKIGRERIETVRGAGYKLVG